MTNVVAKVTKGATRVVAQVAGDGSTDPPGSASPIPDLSPVLFTGPLPFVIIARLEVTAASLDEGQSYELRCGLSRAAALPATVPIVIDTGVTTADPSDYTITSTQGGSTEVSEFIFPVGQTRTSVWINLGANFAQGGSRILALDIESDPNSYVEPSTGSGYRVAVIDSALSSFLLQGNNVVGGTPAFSWATATITVPEDVQPQIVEFPVFLQPALGAGDTPVVLSVSPVELQSGPGYSLLTTSVTFNAGEAQQLVQFEVQNDTVDSPLDTIVQLNLALVSGTANAGATTTLTVTIEDDEPNVSSQRFVQWQTGTEFTIAEGTTTVQLAARIVDGTGAISTLTTLSDVRVVLGGTASEADYRIDWGSSPAGYLRFDAGVSEAALTVTAEADDEDESGETVTLTLNDDTSGNAAWQANTTNGLDVLTITIEDELTGPATELLVPSHTSSATRMVQGLVAINPPSATLPSYELSTGENVQLVGMRRDGDDLWTAAYFYGLAPAAESKPNQAGALTIAERTAGTDPADAGTFVTTPTLTFSLDLAGVGSPMTTTTAVPIDTQWLAGVNDSVEWEQSGPDLVRQQLTRNQFHVSAPTSSMLASGSSANQGAGLLELCETRIAGESEVILFEGRFGPCGWLGEVAGVNVDGFAENIFCDGEMYVDSLDVAVGAGWTIELIDAHPNTANDGTATVDLLTANVDGNGNDQPYWFGAGDSTTFWFALVATGAGAADALLRATDYVRKRNIAWSVGPLGVTENPIYGDSGEYAPDWRRAGLSQGQTTGWDAIEALGETRQTNAIASWTSTSPLVGWNGGGRAGRTLQDPYPSRRQAGGGGISGVFGWMPWAGYWYERMMLNHRIGSRIAHHVDIGGAANTFTSSGPVWAWRNTQTVNGATRTKQQPNPNEIQGGIRMFHFNDHRARQGNASSSSGSRLLNSADGYATAPTSRAWNYPVEIASSLTVSQLSNNGGATTGSTGVVSIDVTGTIPATTPASGLITITRSDGYLHKAAYSSWSGQRFTLNWDTDEAAYADFRAQSGWVGATVAVYEGDPDEYRLADRSQHDMGHTSRFRDGYVDQWWAMRSWLGLSVWQDMASRAVRTYNPWLSFDDYSGANINTANLEAFRRTRDVFGTEWDNTGEFLSSFDRFGTQDTNSADTTDGMGQQPRGIGWALAAAASYFQAAGDTERSEFRGQGGVISLATPRSWLDDMALFIDKLSTEYGVFGRKMAGSPNPWGSSAGFYPPVDWATRSGIVPNPRYNGLPTPPSGEYLYLSGVLGFHNLYAMNAVNSFRKCFPQGSTYWTAFQRHSLYPRRHLQSQTNWLTPSGSGSLVYPSSDQFCTYVHISGYGSSLQGGTGGEWYGGDWPNTPPSRVSLNEFIDPDGPAFCWFVPPGTTRWKWAWLTSQYGISEGEDEALVCAKVAFGRSPTESESSFMSFLMNGAGVNDAMNDTGSIGSSQQQQFAIPLIAYLLQQF